MKKINLILTFLIAGFFAFGQNALIGTWKLAEIPGALSVGPVQGDGSWWYNNSTNDITTRACIFDDSITFSSNGTMTHYMDGNTWLEVFQGVASEQCGAPVAPHDGSASATWAVANNQLTLTGIGAHIGLPKAINGNELDATGTIPVPNDRVYEISISPDGNSFTADIQSAGGGSGWWRFEYIKTSAQSAQAPTSFSVTLKVDASNITVGASGMYAGGGVLGGAMAVQLTDPDGDDIWEGVGTFPPSGGNYVFLNGPANGSDWNAKEDLNGLPCADAANWNDRIMPSLIADSTVCFEFGTCTPCGGTPPPPPPPSYTVTFNVHTDLIAGNVSADGIYIGGGFVGGFDALLLDDSDGDGIWSGSTSLDAAGGHFTILNGNCSDYSCKEDISGQPCADALSYNDRNTLLGGFSQDTTLNLQFGSCTAPQIPSCTVYHADTINTFVSDTLFQNISPQIYLISSQTFPQASNSNCDSIVETWRQFNYSPNYFSDTLTIYDTLTTYDTLITQVFDTLTIYDTTYISISVTDTLYIDITITGVPNVDNTISVYPNPASDVVIIDNGNYNNMSNYNLMIFNSLSQQVFSSQINTQQFQIPVSTLGAEGTYFIQIFDGNNNLVATKYLVLN
jgi:hypothetical protein